jgi:hypothetical protein
MKDIELKFGTPQEFEAVRILEIKSLSYVQRLERLMAIIEISHALKTAKIIQSKKR